MLSHIRKRLQNYEARAIGSTPDTCAGVIIPLCEKDEEVFVVLTKRTDTVRVHKNEVSFPGGMCEEKDGNTLNTALRECHEEIGVRADDVEVIGRLDDMVTLTGFVITPFVGIIPYPYQFNTSPREVAYLIEFPLAVLLQTNPFIEEAEHEGRIANVPSIYYKGDRIWGATCKILLRFRQIIGNERV
jgi:8-oxo-dGTP pyrophosphatase MutT (NUDIX family)